MYSTTPSKELSRWAASAPTETASGRSASVPLPERTATAQAMRRPPALMKAPSGADLPFEEVAAPDEARDEAARRALVKVALRADLAHLAMRHDDEAIRHAQRLVLVMRHHHRGEAELLLQLADLDAHLLAQLGVEIRQGLVEQEHVGAEGERAGERDPLLLAARELARQALAEAFEPHEAQRLGDRARAFLRRPSCASRARRRRSRSTVRCGKSA